MKKAFLLLIAGVIDFLAIVFLALLFWIVSEYASGLLFANTEFVLIENSFADNLNILNFFFLGMAVLYIVFSIIHKRTLGSLLSDKIFRKNALKIFAATVLDFWIVITLTIVLNLGLQNIFFFEALNLFFLLVLFYALISAVFDGKTIGRYLFGIKLISQNGNKHFFKYEIIKFALIIAIPYVILFLLGITDSFALLLDIAVWGITLTVFSLIILKKTIWSQLSNVKKGYVHYTKIRYFLNFVLLVIFFIGSFIGIRSLNNRTQAEITKIAGFNYPYKYPGYPNEKGIESYVEFLKTQNTSPKDYILSLFNTYDIVILQESYHGESTQWDLISEIVQDSVFIDKVGHIFTEYGSAMHQDKIENFLNTKFENDTILEQETAILMDYMTGGFFYFIKNLNLLNSRLPDSIKLMHHYCDVIDWDYFSTFSRVELSKTKLNRDSLLAQVTIDWYKRQCSENKRHKCLIVTNTRHSFGYAGGMEKVKNSKGLARFTCGNQGQYIWEQFPKKTASVMSVKYIPVRVFVLPFIQPIHFGKWEKSFELNGNKPLGFDLKDSPFGDDIFDAKYARGANNQLNYSDIYTGLIFHKPHSDLRFDYYPYRKFAIEQEAIRKGITDSSLIQRKIRFASNEGYSYNFTEAGYINFIPILFYIILGVLNIFLNLIYLILKLSKRK